MHIKIEMLQVTFIEKLNIDITIMIRIKTCYKQTDQMILTMDNSVCLLKKSLYWTDWGIRYSRGIHKI